MENTDIIYIIVKNRTLYENIAYCSINKTFYEISKIISYEQLNKLYYFKKFKRRTFIPKKKLRNTYYTLKNIYINKEDQPILHF